MNRRDFVKVGCAAIAGAGAAKLLPAQGQMQMPAQQNAETTKADYTLQIAPVVVELSPSISISTFGYNGMVPGPLMRVREGVPITVDVINDTDVPELVHWHGLHIPSELDGAEEEGTPPVPPHSRHRYQFVPRPAGTRWYHTHAMAMNDLHRGTYTGQFGFLLIESGNNPGRYDQEVFLALRDWEPYFSSMDTDEMGSNSGPQPEKPATPDKRPNGMEVTGNISSINDKMLGAGEPIRVKQGDRVLMHLLNASAIENRTIAMTGHRFHVLALDGNPVPSQQTTDVVLLGPGERVDAYVDMNRPGVWVLGSTVDTDRKAGMGIVIEYANVKGDPLWNPPPNNPWDYTLFGKATSLPAPDQTIDMLIEKIPGGLHGFNHWTINGTEYPHDQEFVLKQGARYRLVFRNRSDDDHPVHIHRHTFELVDFNGKPTSGIIKDTVVLPTYGRVTVDLVADQPGLTLFHCHIQQHMDYGFKALFRYA